MFEVSEKPLNFLADEEKQQIIGKLYEQGKYHR
jgi:hypothetical protein